MLLAESIGLVVHRVLQCVIANQTFDRPWSSAVAEAMSMRRFMTDARKLYRDELFTAVEFSADMLGQKQQLIKFTRKPKTANTDALEI